MDVVAPITYNFPLDVKGLSNRMARKLARDVAERNGWLSLTETCPCALLKLGWPVAEEGTTPPRGAQSFCGDAASSNLVENWFKSGQEEKSLQ